jgi:S1-C subfamily serine protease
VRVRYKLDGRTQVSSGFFVSDLGHVLTPVVGGKEFYIETCSNWRLSARKCGEDAVTSLCLLQVDAEEWQAYQEEINKRLKDNPALKARRRYFSLLRNGGYPKIGQPIISLSCKLGGSVSPQIGYVTAFQERYFATEFPFVFVRSSLRIDAGDCGGAVLDAQGNLLGMLFHALPDTQETFYMPSQALERLFQDLLFFGNVRYGYAGLSVVTAYDPKTHAVCLQVREVRPNSPAAQSGFKVNDVLLRVNDNEVSSMEMFKNFIFLSKPGDMLRYVVMRGKKTLNLTLTLAKKQ